VPARRELFRQAALDARDGVAAPLVEAAEPKASSWSVLGLLLSLVAALFLGAGLLSVEVTVRAPGALRAPNGLRSVESVLSGAVTEILVQAGDEVAADQVVARLEETQLRATLTLREKELATLRHDTQEADAADAALLRQTTMAAEHQRTALSRRSSIHQTQLRQRSEQLSNLRAMRASGVASGTDELSGEESVQAAAEQIALVGSQLAELNLSLADRRREWKQRELERKAALSRAVAAVDEAKSLLALTEVRSPAAGRVESLLVTPGAVVQPGRVIAQIVPKDAPRSIVAFLPSREVSFVSVGSQANVEIESLPVNEFGMAKAQVKRISADIAKAEEMAAAFGEAMPGSYVRVELELLDDAQQQKMAPHLRSGERVLVRLHRRHQRVLGLIFEFTRKWLGW
jgi:multidrug resistance efflux pump